MNLFNKKVSKNSEKNFLTFFSKEKKASANMWWIIIGAVIALVVVIILMVIFSDTTADLSTGLSSCEGKGGICIKGSCPLGSLPASAFGCNDNTNPDCCLGTPKKTADVAGGCSESVTAKNVEYCLKKN
ncbi:hypothetical protein HOA91_00985 [Candidatus Woesearchaeota archaeon]|nr:hypothetical protein [Candidatus Woesearchaeota archaeon]